MVIAAGSSDIGCVRAENQDRILVAQDELIFVVADGMGGQRCGAYAAQLATDALHEYFRTATPAAFGVHYASPHNGGLQPSQERMATAIRLANERVFRESEIIGECAGMGCTISAVNINSRIATIGNVGDSRIYLYRGGDLVQLTRDDSVLAKLLASGAITPEEAPSHPMRNMLTQSIGAKETVDIQIMEFQLVPGDRLMMSSDGLHGVVGDAAINRILESADKPETTVQQLIAAARERGGPDNISCIVIDSQ